MAYFERPLLTALLERIKNPKGKIQILSGARQVGKTTLIHQALKKIDGASLYKIAEAGYGLSWLDQQWAAARALTKQSPDLTVLAIDEIQKISNWSERVKRLWDEDQTNDSLKNMHIVLLGSSSILLHKGLNESMAGRFEILHIPHWFYQECQNAFGLTVEEYCYFGGYPGALIYKNEEERFLSYMQDAIIEPVVSRDLLSQFIIHKPALLNQLFSLGRMFSGQIFSFNKMLGQMQDAGNTTTLSHYLSLLDQACVLKGLLKYSPNTIQHRQSSPKFQIYNTALMTAASKISFREWKEDPKKQGRWFESMIGAHLLQLHHTKLSYWRENNAEVDFVVEHKGKTYALEIKTSSKTSNPKAQDLFQKTFKPNVMLLVGPEGIPFETFLKTPLSDFAP